MKKFLIYLLLISFLVGIVGFIIDIDFVFAQRELETDYPDIPGTPTPTMTSGIPNYVKYIFNFAIWASGFLALVVLIYGGFQYLTSIGNVEKVRDAKERIASALLGLLILFGSYLILVNINPQLVIFHIPSMYPTFSTLQYGVLVCKEQADVNTAWDLQNEALDPKTSIERKIEIKEQLEPLLERIYEKQCYHLSGAGDIRKEFDNWNLTTESVYIKYIYFIPDLTPKDPKERKFYGAIIYEDKDFKGKAKIIDDALGASEPTEVPIDLEEIKISSIRRFIFIQPEPDHKAVLYEETNFDGQPYNLPQACGGLSFTPQSIEIVGDYIVILYKGISDNLIPSGENQMFFEPGDYDLNNNKKITCRELCFKWQVLCTKSCVKSFCAFGAKLY